MSFSIASNSGRELAQSNNNSFRSSNGPPNPGRELAQLNSNSFRGSNGPRSQKVRTSDKIIELKDHEEVVAKEAERLALTSFDMWALGISIVIGGQYFAWNAGLHAGFGSLLISTFLTATGYFSLVMCIAELSSALPFAGGSYGIARVTLGFYTGFLVAYLDCAESILYVATATYLLGQMITTITGADKSLEPIYWAVFLVTSIMIHSIGGTGFWWLNRILAVSSLVILLIYILGGIGAADFDEYALFDEDKAVDRWFSGGGMDFMRHLPLPCWFFVGVESINLACKDLVAPKVSVPRGSVACILTLLATCVGVLFVCCSLDPGIDVLKSDLNPLNFGFAKIFKISYGAATGLTLPATYATASGFMFCYGRQLRAMGQSGLVSHYLGDTIPGWSTPVYALVAGSAVSFAVCFIVQASPQISAQLFNICMLCAFASYGTQFASFVVLRTKYATIKREFTSPLGMAGAVYGFVVFTLPFIAICGFQENFIAIATFIVFIAIITLYYVCVAQERQFFSEEEKEVMFRAYLMKTNGERAVRMRKGKTIAAQIISGRSTNNSTRSVSSHISVSVRNWTRRGSNSGSRVAPGAECSGRVPSSATMATWPASINSTTPGDSDFGDVGSEPSQNPADWENATGKILVPEERSTHLTLTAITETNTEAVLEDTAESQAALATGRVLDFIV